jgi:hypothetical protein
VKPLDDIKAVHVFCNESVDPIKVKNVTVNSEKTHQSKAVARFGFRFQCPCCERVIDGHVDHEFSNAEYQPPPEPPKAPEPPPTTEYIKGTLEVTSDQVTFRALDWLGFCCFCCFCCFCLGLMIGSIIN